MSISLVIFDLDGVLVDTRSLHYFALNNALEEVDKKYIINHNEHIAQYDGLPTSVKLNMLSEKRDLPKKLHSDIWKRKQELTQALIFNYIKPLPNVLEVFKYLKSKNIQIYVASNSIWKTVKNMLLASELMPYVDYFISNQDVKHTKPRPDMYFECMKRACVDVYSTLICEDSPIGRQAAFSSGAHVCPIIDPSDVTVTKISKYLNLCSSLRKDMSTCDTRWKKPLNVVIPMAGRGSRFKNAGYITPKPLINVKGKTMIQRVVENMNMDAQYIFIVQKEHVEMYDLETYLTTLCPGCKVVQIDGITEGAACTILKARQYLEHSETPMLIANSDQFIEWDSNQFLYKSESKGSDGSILTFECPERDNKWSFISVNSDGFVTELREKEAISDIATVGVYFWAKSSSFCKYADEMIKCNDRIKNEFYVAPVYNYAIKDGLKIGYYHCNKMWGLGTPQDLEYFLNKYNFKNE